MWIARLSSSWVTAVVLLAAGCSSDAVAPEPPEDDPGLPPLAAFVSNAVLDQPPAFPSATGGGGSAPALVAYISIAPGTVPRGARLDVRNLRTDEKVALPMAQGGADPIPITATEGDDLEITATDSAGGQFRKKDSVRTEVPPRVVRVEPAPAATDVPLNRVITVVFSEPVTLASADGRVRLLQGTSPIAAVLRQVAGSPWRVDLVPQEALAPASEYRLEVDAGVKDQDGDELAAPVSATFTTAADGPPPEPVTVLRIRTVTTGEELDGNGYILLATPPGDTPSWRFYALPATGTTQISDLTAGTYRLWRGGPPEGWLGLGNIEDNCEQTTPGFDSDDVVTVELTAGSVAEFTFEVTCVSRDELFGSLEITAATSGPDPDDVYHLMVDGYTWVYGEGVAGPCYWVGCFVDIPPNGTGRLDRGIWPGVYEVSLSWVAPNCEASPARQAVTIQAGATATAAFQVACSALRQLALSFETGGVTGFDIGLFDSNGEILARLTEATGDDVDPAWSSDGARIAFTSGRTGNREIFAMNADGSGQVRLTDHPAADYSPAWSPDGARVAFVSERDGSPQIYVMNADGSGEGQLTMGPGVGTDPDWSPDGSRIAFTSDRDGNTEIYVMNADGSGLQRLTTSTSVDEEPAWSPDGARIAFSSDRFDSILGISSPQIFVMNADGTGVATIPHAWHGHDPAWSIDGRTIAAIIAPPDQVPSYFPRMEVVRVDGTGQTGAAASTVKGVAWRP